MDTFATYKELLQQHGVKPTPNRLLVMSALAEINRPVSLAELECEISTIDKSNIFRTLSTFRAHHLVHAIEGAEQGTCYELCHSHSDEKDTDRHPHFYCEACHHTYCLNDVEMPQEPTLPHGFVTHDTNFFIKGLCPHCSY